MTNRFFSSFFVATSLVALVGCAGTDNNAAYMDTPTVDYVEGLDVYSAPHKDSFLNQLAMNYRSYAVYNARTSGYPDVGELFAQKAVVAFSGETPFPETVGNWNVAGDAENAALETAYNDMMEEFKNGVIDERPDVAAEVQAKFDCWVSAASTGQSETASQCRDRFVAGMDVLKNCDDGGCKLVAAQPDAFIKMERETVKEKKFYPDTRSLRSMGGNSYPRDGIVIVNNVSLPDGLIKASSVSQQQPPMIFNQNIYGGDKSVSNSGNTLAVNSGGDKNVSNSGNTSIKSDVDRSVSNSGNTLVKEEVDNSTNDSGNTMIKTESTSKCDCKTGRPVDEQGGCSGSEEGGARAVPPESVCPCEDRLPPLSEETVTRDEFISMMMAMRAEIQAINERLDALKPNEDKAVIKVQQIPLEPTQHVMEEIFEVHFDFNKAVIKPEYADLIRDLASATQANKNIKVSVVGHTDTVGTNSYNYALGGRRAEAVQKMLIEYGIPASQIVAVSAGEEDLKVKTGDGVKNAENRRVRVVKETFFTEPAKVVPVATVVTESGSNKVEVQEECEDCEDL